MIADKISTFPILSTHKLTLRQLSYDDKEEIYQIRSDKKIAEFLDRPICRSSDEAKEFIKKVNDGFNNKTAVYWAITEKGKTKLIGTICLWKISLEKLKAEIAFELFPEWQGKGIMKEVVPKVLDFAFNELGLKTLEGEVAKKNQRSIKLMEKNGFKIKSVYAGDDNTLIYELLNK